MWCKNVLTIDGPDSAVKEFQTKVYTNEYCVIDAESICPTLNGMEDVVERRKELWGCPWVLCQFVGTREAWFESKTIQFCSAISAPLALFAEAAKQHPSVRFKLAYQLPSGVTGQLIWN